MYPEWYPKAGSGFMHRGGVALLSCFDEPCRGLLLVHGHHPLQSVDIFFRMGQQRGRVFFIDNLLIRIHFIIVMIKWTGLAP